MTILIKPFSPSHPLAALHIAWIARTGALTALRAAGVPLAGHSFAVRALTPVVLNAIIPLSSDALPTEHRDSALSDPLLWAHSLLTDADLIA